MTGVSGPLALFSLSVRKVLGGEEQDVPKQSCRASLEGTEEEPVPTGARNKGFCLTVLSTNARQGSVGFIQQVFIVLKVS